MNAPSTNAMNAREEKARTLAQHDRVEHVRGAVWVVPSQSGNGGYLVDLGVGSCECADYKFRRARCKHIVAAALKGATR